ncbi:MAG: replication initiator protein A, partial [Oscillospiraceae bacterium]|nr:replication initiator protein A [Oscillospiraceae bacterium]
MSFGYFYGSQSESFSFYRIPRELVTGEYFRSLSTDAKLLYGLLLDRMGLSAKNNWLDQNGRVYIYYTVEEIAKDINCGLVKAGKLLAELDTAKGIGLIERVKQGQGKPTIIYVKQFTMLVPIP